MRTKGFTIVELMMAAAICILIMGIGLMILVRAMETHEHTKTRIRQNANARLVFNLLEKDLGNSIKDSAIIYTQSLTLRANLDEVGAPEVGEVCYWWEGGAVHRSVEGVEAELCKAEGLKFEEVCFGPKGYEDVEDAEEATHVLVRLLLDGTRSVEVGIPLFKE